MTTQREEIDATRDTIVAPKATTLVERIMNNPKILSLLLPILLALVVVGVISMAEQENLQSAIARFDGDAITRIALGDETTDLLMNLDENQAAAVLDRLDQGEQ